MNDEIKIKCRESYLLGIRRAGELIEEELDDVGLEWGSDACYLLSEEFRENSAYSSKHALLKMLRKHIRCLEDDDEESTEWEIEEERAI